MINRKRCMDRYLNYKLLIGILREIIEYTYEPTIFRLKVIKDLLSKVEFTIYNQYLLLINNL